MNRLRRAGYIASFLNRLFTLIHMSETGRHHSISPRLMKK